MIELAVARWAAWAPGIESAEAWRAWAAAPSALASEPPAPSAAEVPALLRRRCDALSRALLHVAGACCAEAEAPVGPGRGVTSSGCADPNALASRVATVFATRYGPLGAIVENLEALASGRHPSPMTFSHAVHNTALGLYSIWTKNRAPGSALAAGEATFAHGWLEAALLLQREPIRSVLLVCGDAALPSELAPLARSAAHPPHAFALLLCSSDDAAAGAERVRFCFAPRGAREPAQEAQRASSAGPALLPPPLAFLRWWLEGDKELTLAQGQHACSWQRA